MRTLRVVPIALALFGLLQGGAALAAPDTASPASPVPAAAAPFTFVVFGDNRPESVDKPLPDVFKQILIEVAAPVMLHRVELRAHLAMQLLAQ